MAETCQTCATIMMIVPNMDDTVSDMFHNYNDGAGHGWDVSDISNNYDNAA